MENPSAVLPAKFAMRDRGRKLTVPSTNFVQLLYDLEKCYRISSKSNAVLEKDIVRKINKSKYFPNANDKVLSLAMARYVRLRAHITTEKNMQIYHAKKREKTNATRKKLKNQIR